MSLLRMVTFSWLVCSFLLTATLRSQDYLDVSKGWKFRTGDNLEWAQPDFDDSQWTVILPNHVWEVQGFSGYDGYAWYRLKVVIPSELKTRAFKGATLRLAVGKVNDADQTFFNGRLIGQNGDNVSSKHKLNPMPESGHTHNIFRIYDVPISDDIIVWDQENVIAVRVFDQGNQGGMYASQPYIRISNLSDVLKIETHLSDFKFVGESTFQKSIVLQNHSTGTLHGDLYIKVFESNSGIVMYESKHAAVINPDQDLSVNYVFEGIFSVPYRARYEFVEKTTDERVVCRQQVPYLQTPQPPDRPRINGPKIYGVRPGSPFLYRIPATGKRPMRFSVDNLPGGLALDPDSGIFSGSIQKAGNYDVTLSAENECGSDQRQFKIVVGNRLALTPPMGWNSWYIHYDRVTDKLMRRAADQMTNSGMADYGYQYVNIDDCWMVKAGSDDPVIGGHMRDENGAILTNKNFPDMKAMTDYIHSKGLKAGIYISPGETTCAGYAGSYLHEQQDAQTFADWGFDFLKYDLCSYREVMQGNSEKHHKEPYTKMWGELAKLDRDIVLNLCQYGLSNVWEWGAEVGNCWRTTGDLGLEDRGDMPGFFKIGISNAQYWPFARPGGWNDPDYILIGWVGSAYKMGEGEKTTLTPDEQYFYMSMWSLMAAPLIFSGDMAKLDPFTLNVLCNNEVINVNQDELGRQAKIFRHDEKELVLVKELVDGSKAIGLFNLENQPQKLSIEWADLNLNKNQLVRDVWRQKDMGRFGRHFEQLVPAHGVFFMLVSE